METLPVIDYVLMYDKQHPYAKQRLEFLKRVKQYGLQLDPDELWDESPEGEQRKQGNKYGIIKIHAPFEPLSRAAERMRLKMPLAELIYERINGHLQRLLAYFATKNKVNYISTHYEHDKRHLFQGIENEETFFRPALRSLIVDYILRHITMEIENESIEEPRKKVLALPYLLMKKAFKSAFILHDTGTRWNSEGEPLLGNNSDFAQNIRSQDSWTELNNQWANTYLKFQPLREIRNYFGEKIALYFAVMETLLLSLIIPALLGLSIFFYGLYYSVMCSIANRNINEFLNSYNYSKICSSPEMIADMIDMATDSIKACDNIAGGKRTIEQAINVTCVTIAGLHRDSVFQVPSENVFNVIKSSFDNAATPWFGLIICLWGTIFLEVWKRINAKLVYEWNVQNYEIDEPTRPEFYGTTTKMDPVTGEIEPYYSGTERYTKMLLSFSVGILMVGGVVASVIGVIIYKTWTRIKVKTNNSVESFLLTTVVGSLLNAVSIIILGKVYQIIAFKMTDWENHRTQTAYNDALILKLFAFHFTNGYSSLFYIAFFRRNNQPLFEWIGLPGLKDNCDELNNCMSELSIQVVTLMLIKLYPKVMTDIFIPWVRALQYKIFTGKTSVSIIQHNRSKQLTVDEYILLEYKKPDLGDFTLGEYTEKVIQYGYQMLFCISFPLAPLFFFITILCDIRVDAKRLLRIYKRPIAFMAQDIGHWFTILNLINGIAVITNACLVAFNTNFGRERPFHEQLIIIILIEHIVFIVKFMVATMIPDVPQNIQLAMRKEKHEVQKKMKEYKQDMNQLTLF